jgi:hypothetical protein
VYSEQQGAAVKFRKLNTQESENAGAVLFRANLYSDQCKVLYSGAQQCRARKLADYAREAFLGKVFLDFRKTFVAIKIEARKLETRHRDWRNLFIDEHNVIGLGSPIETPQGYIFRFKV